MSILRRGILSQKKQGGFITDDLHLHTRGSHYTTNTSPWNDISGNNNNIPLFNNVPLNGDLLDFDGSSDFGQRTLSGINLNSSFTLEVVAKFDSWQGSWRSLMNVRRSTAGGIGREFFEFRHSPSGQLGFEWLDFNGHGLSGGYTSVGVGNLFHSAITWDGSGFKLYTNSSLEFTGTTTFFNISTNSILNICRAYDNTRNSDNSIGMIRMYSKALTQSEVVQNFDYEQTQFIF